MSATTMVLVTVPVGYHDHLLVQRARNNKLFIGMANASDMYKQSVAKTAGRRHTRKYRSTFHVAIS